MQTTHAYQNMFESSVISYGSQTEINKLNEELGFESSVISYGSQTHSLRNIA